MIKRPKDREVPAAAEIVDQFVQAKDRLEQNTLSTRDVAARFNVTRGAIYRWVEKGLIEPCGQIDEYGYIFEKSQVERFTPPRRGPKPRLDRGE